jgi:putative membrane protein
MSFLYFKALHIIFVVTWFAGLFYLPRIMVYAAEASRMENELARSILLNQYKLMSRRLLYGITWPSAIITLFLGIRLVWNYPMDNWLWVKLAFVALLYAYMFSLQKIYAQQSRGLFRYSGQQLRAWNEVPTILLFAIVFLVVLKSTLNFWWGMLTLLGLVVLIMAGIRIYKAVRNKS